MNKVPVAPPRNPWPKILLALFLALLTYFWNFLKPILFRLTSSEWMGIILELLVVLAILETFTVSMLTWVVAMLIGFLVSIFSFCRFVLILALAGLAFVEVLKWLKSSAEEDIDENRELD